MPKKKKTLKHKLQTDKRRQETTVGQESVQSETGTFSLPQSYVAKKESPRKKITPTTQTISTHEYAYLGRDLLKTTLLTGSIICIEILIRYYIERG